MEKLKQLLHDLTHQHALIHATLSQVRRRDPALPSKITVKPVELKGRLHYQFSLQLGSQVKHENWLPEQAWERLYHWFEVQFRQGLLRTRTMEHQILISKKYKVSTISREIDAAAPDLSHDRKKRRLLEEGRPVPFLVELGVMTPEGKVVAKKYDKFRQINRFLEMIDDIIPYLPKNRPLRIVDFGCGKSYLTFALHHFLRNVKGFEANITGLDLKEEVIRHCSGLAETLGCTGLRFEIGDIARYSGSDEPDLVVSLHACDTATDAALEKAVRWKAKVILSVPCCQHELFGQLNSPVLEPLLAHGILKERFASLATDALRAKLLDICGYRTQLLEFIDLEHTPKNILIRAIRTEEQNTAHSVQEYVAFRDFLSASPYLERALEDILSPIFEKYSVHEN